MFWNLLDIPLLRRSVMLDSRSFMTYLIRFIILLVLFLPLYVSYHNYIVSSNTSAPGLIFFTIVSFLNIVVISFGGILFFSTIVSEEREEETLGLLLMTGIHPVSLLISKFVSRLMQLYFLLLTQVPFVVLAITLGGTSISQIAAVFYSFLVYLFFVAAVSLFCSVLANSSGRAYGFSVVILMFYFSFHVFVYFVYGFYLYLINGVNSLNFDEGFFRLWSEMSPIYQFNLILNVKMYSLLNLQVAVNLIGGSLFILMACILFIRFHSVGFDEYVEGLFRENRLVQHFHKRKRSRVWSRAVFWKDYVYCGKGNIGIIVRVAVYLTIFLIVVNVICPASLADAGSTIFYTGLFAVFVEISFYYSNLFNRELKENTYESLRLLPESSFVLTNVKIFSIFPFLIPVFSFLAVGIGIDYLDPWKEIDFWEMFFAFICMYSHFSMLLLLLSVYMKNGSFLISLVATIMLFIIVISLKPFFRSGLFGDVAQFAAFLELILAIVYYIAFVKVIPQRSFS